MWPYGHSGHEGDIVRACCAGPCGVARGPDDGQRGYWTAAAVHRPSCDARVPAVVLGGRLVADGGRSAPGTAGDHRCRCARDSSRCRRSCRVQTHITVPRCVPGLLDGQARSWTCLHWRGDGKERYLPLGGVLLPSSVPVSSWLRSAISSLRWMSGCCWLVAASRSG